MKIALDYDDTYTADPIFWNDFIDLVKKHNHEIVILTKRGETNRGCDLVIPGVEVHYSDRRAKLKYAEVMNLGITIWIDDSPINLFMDG